ncbi:MAG TPA: GNAT family N-acetyltransferase [Gaiellaceae bacterium]|nr:GNAT family N-acetyltransferase [Gaiellaceae bacterium]
MIRRADPLSDADVEALAQLLVDSVDQGASVGFMHPLELDDARAFWRRVADGVAAGERALLVAEDEEGLLGTVHLVLAQPPNQPHRADVTKLLVHPRARRRGVGAALMNALEELALDLGRNVLVLDTVTGNDADRLYTRLGWQRVGEIPDFALLAHGGLGPTTVFFKRLGVEEPRPPVRELRVAVTADDFDRALAFYRDTLGLQERAAFSSEDGRVVILEAGRATLELLDPPHAAYVDEVEVGRRVAGHIRLALEVDDSAATTRTLAEAGADVLAEPTRTPWSSLNARLEAPAGLQLTLFTELG